MCKTQEFINKLEKVNPNYKDYYEILNSCEENHQYVFTKTKYGICKSLKANLLKGFNSSIAAAVNPTEYFINAVKEKFGDIYLYDKIEYKLSKDKILVGCKIHEEYFEISATNFLGGQGCQKCGIIKNHDAIRTPIEEFIKRGNKIYENKFDYSLVNYKNKDSYITVICPIHGEFITTPHGHTHAKTGCVKCNIENKKKYKPEKTIKFIKESKLKHGDKYDYSLVKYMNNTTKVKIKCNTCLETFEQSPANHKWGFGCNTCGINKRGNLLRNKPNGWSWSVWKESGEKSASFDSYKLYVLKCTDIETNETFYKIGKLLKKLIDDLHAITVYPMIMKY